MSNFSFEDSPSKPMQANELLQGLTDAARDNPLPTALLGAGLLWVLSRDIAARISTGGTSIGTKRARAESPGLSINEGVSSQDLAGRKVIQRVREAQNALANLWEEQPLVAGAIGLAIGAGLASLFPATDVEAGILGPQAERLATTTKRLIAQPDDAQGIAEI